MAVDFEIFSGDSVTLNIPITDPDGAVVDVSTASAITFVIVDSKTRANVVEKDLDDGISADEDAVTVTLLPADTDELRGSYITELEVIDAGGNVYTALQGTVSIKRDYA